MKPTVRISLHLYVFVSVVALSTSFALGASLEGKVKKNVYYSPAGNFSVPLPSDWAGKINVNDSYDKKNGVGAVSFHSDFGMQVGIHYMLLPPEVLTKEQPDWRDALERWLHAFGMQVWFLPVSPKSQVLHEAFISFEGLNALVAEVKIPEGSFMVNMMTGKRLDSRRGLVIFQKGRYIYMLSTEGYEHKEKWMAFADTLEPFFKSIVFTE